ncbi:MAG: FMN-binding protein, partial [Planctomycetota bacterium]|nr:FMN-binding protein [Planctomycetota bacterium]
MGEKARFSIVLLSIAGACVAALGGVYFGVKQKLDEARLQKMLEAASAACRIGDKECISPAQMKEYKRTGRYTDENGVEREIVYFEPPTGYVVESSGKGYAGKVTVVVGWDKELKRILHIVVTDHRETPGLGANVKQKNSENTLWDVVGGSAKDESELRPWFERHFDGLSLEQLVPKQEPISLVLKDGSRVGGEVFSEDAHTITLISGGE